MLYLLVVSMMSCLFTGVLSRSVPFVPQRCEKAFTLENECTSQISTFNMSDYVSFRPLHVADNYLDEGCRFFGEYRRCIAGYYTYLENNCPSVYVTYADALIRYYTPSCKTYKEDQAALIPCINDNEEVRKEVIVCWKRLAEKARVGGIEFIKDCRLVYGLIKCFDALEQCNQPQHFANFRKYLEETRADFCSLTTIAMGYRD